MNRAFSLAAALVLAWGFVKFSFSHLAVAVKLAWVSRGKVAYFSSTTPRNNAETCLAFWSSLSPTALAAIVKVRKNSWGEYSSLVASK